MLSSAPFGKLTAVIGAVGAQDLVALLVLGDFSFVEFPSHTGFEMSPTGVGCGSGLSTP